MSDVEARLTLKKIQSDANIVVLFVVSVLFFSWVFSVLYGSSIVSLFFGAAFGVFVAGLVLYFYLNYEQLKKFKQNPFGVKTNE